MKFFRKWPVRVLLFCAGFLLLNQAMEFAFLSINREPLVVMHDMSLAEEPGIVFVGNSLSRRHIDNAIIEEALGTGSFNLSVSSCRIAGAYAMMQELFRYQQPKMLVFVVDPSTFREAVVVQSGLWPNLRSWETKLTYAWKNSRIDGKWLDRFFPWRSFYPESVEQLRKIWNWKLDPETCYTSGAEVLRSDNGKVQQFYDGKGYCPAYTVRNEKALHNVRTRKLKAPKDVDTATLHETLWEMKRLCERNGCEFVVLTPPMMPEILLGNGDAVFYLAEFAAFCEENEVTLLNFAYEKGDLFDELEPHLYNEWHLDKDGAEIFSTELAKVLREYLDGQDVSGYFYTSKEYAKARNFVLSAWYAEKTAKGKIAYTADCICGSGVEPQYQFTAVDDAGRETLLQEYTKSGKYTCKEEEMEGKSIQIRVRNAAALEQPPVTAVKK